MQLHSLSTFAWFLGQNAHT